jgi:hypothetical protein
VTNDKRDNLLFFANEKYNVRVMSKMNSGSVTPSNEFCINLGSKAKMVVPNNAYGFVINLLHSKKIGIIVRIEIVKLTILCKFM